MGVSLKKTIFTCGLQRWGQWRNKGGKWGYTLGRKPWERFNSLCSKLKSRF